eukprot:2328277-Prymnesium_polylepis.1
MLNDAGGPRWSYESRAVLLTFVWKKKKKTAQAATRTRDASARTLDTGPRETRENARFRFETITKRQTLLLADHAC